MARACEQARRRASGLGSLGHSSEIPALNRTVQGNIDSGILGDLSLAPVTPMVSKHSKRPGRGIGRPALRRRFRQRRRLLSAAEQAEHAESVARLFFTSGLVRRGRTIGLYLANDADGELSTEPLLARLLRARKRVALPVVSRAGTMRFHRYRRGAPLVTNRYGIREPGPGAAPVSPLGLDLVLMPLVAFDDRGVRLGMGAGYYDRYLGRLPPALRPRLIGLAHEVQRSPEPLPRAQWDVPLDGVLTEAGLHSFI